MRLANCLRVAAGRASWGAKKLPPNTGMGIAVSSAEERQSPTWVAGIAEVTVDPKTGRYKINRLTIAMDPGTVINPLCAKAQIQGAALWGASQVMAERLTLKNGAFEQSNFHDYTPIRLADVPPIDVELIDFGPPPERRRRTRVHGCGAGGRQRDLQRGRRTRAAYADHGGGGSGGLEKGRDRHRIVLTEHAGLRSRARHDRLARFNSPRRRPAWRPRRRTTAWFLRMVQRTGRAAKLPFPVHPHMLRHSTGFKLANDGHDTRSLAHYLGLIKGTESKPKRSSRKHRGSPRSALAPRVRSEPVCD